MTMPAIVTVARIVGLIQLGAYLIDQFAVHLLNQLQRQSLPRLTPGCISEWFIPQMMHRRTGDVAARHLLGKQPQRVARRERPFPKLMPAITSELIDLLGDQKMVRAVTDTRQSLGERRH